MVLSDAGSDAGLDGHAGPGPCDPVDGPVATAVEGTLDSGEEVTVQGCGFGRKDPVEPVLWDDFESASASDGWSDLNELWEVYTGDDQVTGSQACLRWWVLPKTV